MKVEIFVTPTTPVNDIASAFPKHDHDRVKPDDKNGVVTIETNEANLSDNQITWLSQQKEHGRVERVEIA